MCREGADEDHDCECGICGGDCWGCDCDPCDGYEEDLDMEGDVPCIFCGRYCGGTCHIPLGFMTRVKMAFDRILYDLYESKEHWLLAMLYRLFRLGQTQGPLMLEAHYEHPEDSSIFAAGKLSFDEREFLCDSLRMIVRGGHSADVRRIMERDFANRWVLLPWKRARYRLMIEGLCAYAEGCPPLFAVDAARRSLPSIWAVRPRFDEMEAICSHLPLDIARVDGPSHAELEAAMEEILRRKRGGNDDEPSGC